MRFCLLSVSLLLSYAAAQSTTACAAQPVLEACLASTEAIAEGCSPTDYQCLCQKYKDVLTCFNQCPNDPRQSSILSKKETYCNDASVYTSSASVAVTSAASTPSSASGSAATEAAKGGNTSSGAVAASSSTGSSSSAASTGGSKSGAESLVIGAGGVIMCVAGLVGAFM